MNLPEPVSQRVAVGRVASLEPASGESAPAQSRLSPLAAEYCIELLHDLNNAFAVVLMNAQALDGKLPSYSRSKRYIHEIERGAQRGAALLKRLLERMSVDGFAREMQLGFEVSEVPPVAERVAVASQGPSGAAEDIIGLASFTASHAAPVLRDDVADAHNKV